MKITVWGEEIEISQDSVKGHCEICRLPVLIFGREDHNNAIHRYAIFHLELEIVDNGKLYHESCLEFKDFFTSKSYLEECDLIQISTQTG